MDVSPDLGFHAFVRNNVHCKDKHTAEQIKQLVQGSKALNENLFSVIGPQGAI